MGTDPDQTTQSSTTPEYVDTEATFDEILAAKDRVLVDFYADWCGPCKVTEPIVDELAGETDAVVVKVDVDAIPGLAGRYNVRSIPTFMGFADGEETDRLVGVHDKQALLALVN